MMHHGLLRSRTFDRCQQVIVIFASNWLFGSQLIAKSFMHIKKKAAIVLKLKSMVKMPAYYTASIKKLRSELARFFELHFDECIKCLEKAVHRLQREMKEKIDEMSTRRLKMVWVNREIRNRQHVHYNQVIYYARLKQYMIDKYSDS